MKFFKELRQEHIIKTDGKYRLVSKKTGKNLGTYDSKEGAEKRERQVQYFKHMGEEIDKKDTVTFDIPLLIRVLELAREDVKSDMELHRIVERLLNMRKKGTLTMDDYDSIANLKEDAGAISAGPTNVVGGGAIAGTGGRGGEPGVDVRKRKRITADARLPMGIGKRKDF